MTVLARLSLAAALGVMAVNSLLGEDLGPIDYGAVGNPQLVRLADRHAETRWRALFEADVQWPSRQIAYLTDRLPSQAPTLMAARLLYVGEPWSRRQGEQGNLRRWRSADREVKLAIQREMRGWPLPPDAVRKDLGMMVALHLQQELEPTLVASSLVTLHRWDRALAGALALRLADPRPADRLPGSAVAGVRQDSLRYLLSVQDPEGEACRRALTWALLEGRSGERLHALTLLSRGRSKDLLRNCLLRLAKGFRELDDEDRTALVVACGLLGGEPDPELVAALAEVVVAAPRELAVPSAGALAANATWAQTVPLARVEERAAKDPDPAVRAALCNLLLRVDARARDLGGAESPWSLLSRHRARLTQWEWEHYVR
jgi:hypothetical protein